MGVDDKPLQEIARRFEKITSGSAIGLSDKLMIIRNDEKLRNDVVSFLKFYEQED